MTLLGLYFFFLSTQSCATWDFPCCLYSCGGMDHQNQKWNLFWFQYVLQSNEREMVTGSWEELLACCDMIFYASCGPIFESNWGRNYIYIFFSQKLFLIVVFFFYCFKFNLVTFQILNGDWCFQKFQYFLDIENI